MTVVYRQQSKKILTVQDKHLFYFILFYLQTINLMSNAFHNWERLTIPDQCKSTTHL